MKIEKTLYIQAVKWDWEGGFNIEIRSAKQSSNENKVVMDVDETSFSLDVPDVDEAKFTLVHIEQLQKMKLQVLADNQVRLQAVDDQIASLQALEHKAGGE